MNMYFMNYMYLTPSPPPFIVTCINLSANYKSASHKLNLPVIITNLPVKNCQSFYNHNKHSIYVEKMSIN